MIIHGLHSFNPIVHKDWTREQFLVHFKHIKGIESVWEKIEAENKKCNFLNTLEVKESEIESNKVLDKVWENIEKELDVISEPKKISRKNRKNKSNDSI